MPPASRAIRVPVPASPGEISALLLQPKQARVLYVLAHGAGAGMDHPFMNALADALADQGIATFRFQFPYMEAGRRRPDAAPVLLAAVRAAIDAARDAAPGLRLIAGGKSMGGRMTSLLMAETAHPAIEGLAFVGFPLHPAGKPAARRGEHLPAIRVPMLFLQGTRDTLADLDLLRPIIRSLGKTATLHVIDGADHAFHMLRRSGRTDQDVVDELAHTLAAWVTRRVLRSRRGSRA